MFNYVPRDSSSETDTSVLRCEVQRSGNEPSEKELERYQTSRRGRERPSGRSLDALGFRRTRSWLQELYVQEFPGHSCGFESCLLPICSQLKL